MKSKISILSVFILALFINACVKNDSVIETARLSEEDNDAITKEIMDVTTDWIKFNKNMDADKAIEFWDSSDSLMFAENGAFFANRDSIHAFLKSFYAQTKKMDLEWGNRVIVPLSKNAATVSGYLHFKATFKTDDVYEGNSMFTGVFVKKNNKWVLLHGHESIEQRL